MSDPDGAEQRQDQLRRDAAQCWAEVKTVVDAEDPEGLLKGGAPLGEYDPEIEDLVRLVRHESVTPTRVLKIWERWFGPNSCLNRDPEMLQRLTLALTRIPRASRQEPPRNIDTSVAHSARVWNYLLGGKDHYPVDREAAEQALAFVPNLAEDARADRGFLVRAVRYLVGEAGIRQFLDIGTGLPTVNNTHEVAQAIAPQCRIVYADNDPLVLVHARALLTSTPEGATDYLHADLRDPNTILWEAARTLDFTQPIGLMLLGIMRAAQLRSRLAAARN